MLSEHPERSVVADGTDDADVVLYDVLGLHASDGEDLDELLSLGSAVVVAVSWDLRPDLRARALARGVHGWVSLSAKADELIAAVEAAAVGQPVPGPGDPLGAEVGLTAREVEVLALVTQGLSNNQIAERLYLSINSVKSYIRSAYGKIGVKSRTQAVAWCLLHGFAPPGT
jgi:DNA-binding NarL/FixJ family response regulator